MARRRRVIPCMDQEFEREDPGHHGGGHLVRPERYGACQAPRMPRVHSGTGRGTDLIVQGSGAVAIRNSRSGRLPDEGDRAE